VDLQRCKEILERAGVTFGPGLADDELAAAEQRYGFAFPPDLREYLAYALPTGKGFPNWRDLDDPTTQAALVSPLEGLCFDVEHNGFWLDDWGPRPADLPTAFRIAAQQVHAAPPLIPLRGHRYLPALPAMAGNPVFSVHQTDVIYYGATLENYLRNEYPYYFGSGGFHTPPIVREIAFWSRLVEENS
jgi:hypothetical protein